MPLHWKQQQEPNFLFPSHPSSHCSEIYVEEGIEDCKNEEPEVVDSSKEIAVSRRNREDDHMYSQGLWQHAHDLHKFKPDKTPPKGEWSIEPHPMSKEI